MVPNDTIFENGVTCLLVTGNLLKVLLHSS